MVAVPYVASQRLRNQYITRPGPKTAAQVVAWFGAMQAQEYGPAKWALGLRMPRGTTEAAIERAVDQGRILRTHVLRPTWHFVAPADIRWMLALTAPHVLRAMSTYWRHLGLDAAKMTRAATIFERALGDRGCLTRAELGADLERAGLPGKGTALALFAMYAEFEGLMCSGPRRGNKFTYGLLADRAPRAKALQREEALAELARRFLRSHGPATIRDFVWWSGLTTADARRAFEMNRARRADVNGLAYWTLARTTLRAGSSRSVHLLPVYDEFLVAYRDRGVVPHATQSLGNFWHALVIGGTVAGSWRTVRNAREVVVDVTMLRPLTRLDRLALMKVAERYGRFLGTPVSLRLR